MHTEAEENRLGLPSPRQRKPFYKTRGAFAPFYQEERGIDWFSN